MHALERHIQPAQEVESLEDDEARDDDDGRGDGRDDVARHFRAYVSTMRE